MERNPEATSEAESRLDGMEEIGQEEDEDEVPDGRVAREADGYDGFAEGRY